jgi:microcystin degradation protein MlrC
MKVGIVALLQETNAFAPGVTTAANFADDVLLVAEANDGLTVIRTSKRTPPQLGSNHELRRRSVQFKAIVGKGVNPPVAAYREICTNFIRVDTPGATAADMSTLAYRDQRNRL